MDSVGTGSYKVIELFKEGNPVVSFVLNVHLDDDGPVTGWQIELDPSSESPEDEILLCLADMLASLDTAKEQIASLAEELIDGS